MKIFIDALGAPEKSGGMRLYVDGVVRGWLEAYPEDQLNILAPRWVETEFATNPNVRVFVLKEGLVLRVVGQFVLSAILYHLTRSRVMISLSPVVTPLVKKARRTCTPALNGLLRVIGCANESHLVEDRALLHVG